MLIYNYKWLKHMIEYHGFFFTKVLKRFGFSEVIIDMVWRLVSNNWYYVLINGQPHCFSTPWEELIKVLSKGLNNLHGDSRFLRYGMHKWSPGINNISYVDETTLFCSGDRVYVIKMMKILKKYKQVTRQLINKIKSSFFCMIEPL